MSFRKYSLGKCEILNHMLNNIIDFVVQYGIKSDCEWSNEKNL